MPRPPIIQVNDPAVEGPRHLATEPISGARPLLRISGCADHGHKNR